MAFELERGNITEFAHLLSKHWNLSVALDPGTTNTCIEYIFTCCDDLIDGRFIAGAGGGGFLMMVLKRGKTKQMLAERLDEMFQESGVAIWECEILNNVHM
jgi:fucokinase